MKNLCRKGRVHPSSSSSASTSASASACRDMNSVLRLLPVAVAALSAALPPEDQEVLAYLIARARDVPDLPDMKKHRKQHLRRNNFGAGAGAGADDESPQPWSPSAPAASAGGGLRTHRASFECSCFQCYMSYWSRWNASPSREVIHEAIDLFEELTADAAGGAGGSRSKHQQQRAGKAARSAAKDDRARAGERDSSKAEDAAASASPAPAPAKAKQIVPLAFEEEDIADGDEAAPAAEEEESVAVSSASVAVSSASSVYHPFGGRGIVRRMLPDIMGFVADHLWTAWSSTLRPSNG